MCLLSSVGLWQLSKYKSNLLGLASQSISKARTPMEEQNGNSALRKLPELGFISDTSDNILKNCLHTKCLTYIIYTVYICEQLGWAGEEMHVKDLKHGNAQSFSEA